MGGGRGPSAHETVKWSVHIRSRGEKEIAEAWKWYEKRQPGLGDRLIDEVSRAVHTLEQDADRFPLYYRNFRRILLVRFPYKIFYMLEGNRAVIFRVLHAKREHRSRLPHEV